MCLRPSARDAAVHVQAHRSTPRRLRGRRRPRASRGRLGCQGGSLRRQDHRRPQGHLRPLQGRDEDQEPLLTATPVSCLAMQSGYSPMGGMDSWNPPISFPVNQDNLRWKDEKANTGLLRQPRDEELRVLDAEAPQGHDSRDAPPAVPVPGPEVPARHLRGVKRLPRRDPFPGKARQGKERATAPLNGGRSPRLAGAQGRCRGGVRDRGRSGRAARVPDARRQEGNSDHQDESAASERGLDPIPSRNGMFAPALTSASTSVEPSAFITTTE